VNRIAKLASRCLPFVIGAAVSLEAISALYQSFYSPTISTFGSVLNLILLVQVVSSPLLIISLTRRIAALMILGAFVFQFVFLGSYGHVRFLAYVVCLTILTAVPPRALKLQIWASVIVLRA
jgi:hypothetical protein